MTKHNLAPLADLSDSRTKANPLWIRCKWRALRIRNGKNTERSAKVINRARCEGYALIPLMIPFQAEMQQIGETVETLA